MFAFFDLDGTLIRPKSILSFYEFYLRNEASHDADKVCRRFFEDVSSQMSKLSSRMELNSWFYSKYFKGLSRNSLASLGERWFDQQISANFFHEPILSEMRIRQREGYEVALVTGSFFEVVKPIADHLNITTLLCAPLEEKNGCYTGHLLASPTIGKGKVDAIKKLLSERSELMNASYGYGDDVSDLNFLELVETPIAFDNAELKTIAEQRGWQFIAAQV